MADGLQKSQLFYFWCQSPNLFGNESESFKRSDWCFKFWKILPGHGEIWEKSEPNFTWHLSVPKTASHGSCQRAHGLVEMLNEHSLLGGDASENRLPMVHTLSKWSWKIVMRNLKKFKAFSWIFLALIPLLLLPHLARHGRLARNSTLIQDLCPSRPPDHPLARGMAL